jgi:hypothetical protein
MQYTQDYDEMMPRTQYPSGTSWRQNVQAYIKSMQVFSCPSGGARTPYTGALLQAPTTITRRYPTPPMPYRQYRGVWRSVLRGRLGRFHYNELHL